MTKENLHQYFLILQEKRIFFGHQSVGTDIINGVKDISSEFNDINLNLIRVDTPLPGAGGYFAETNIGKNTKPDTKCDDFGKKIESLFSGRLDAALMKFCFVDINAQSHIEALFTRYRSSVESLKIKYPNIIFIHVTVPLTTKAGGIRHYFKSLFGYSSENDLENVKRNEYNSLLTDFYQNDPIFDLAAAESTYPDGRREIFRYGEKEYYSLIKDYTDDGGHLNTTGRKFAAEKLIQILGDALAVK